MIQARQGLVKIHSPIRLIRRAWTNIARLRRCVDIFRGNAVILAALRERYLVTNVAILQIEWAYVIFFSMVEAVINFLQKESLWPDWEAIFSPAKASAQRAQHAKRLPDSVWSDGSVASKLASRCRRPPRLESASRLRIAFVPCGAPAWAIRRQGRISDAASRPREKEPAAGRPDRLRPSTNST